MDKTVTFVDPKVDRMNTIRWIRDILPYRGYYKVVDGDVYRRVYPNALILELFKWLTPLR